MADAEFIKKEVAKFRAEHPATNGWKVVRIQPMLRQTFIPILPAFLRAHRPTEFEETITTELGIVTKPTRHGRRSRLTAMPRLQRGEGMDETDWAGDITLTWQKSPIHVRRIWLPFDGSIAPNPLTMLAFKDDAALEDFYAVGIKFITRKNTALRTSVWVVNGPNYPRPKAKWDDLILPADLKQQIRENFEGFIGAKKHYKELGLPYRRGFLLVGPPGNGKTMVTKVIGGTYRINMVALILKSDLDEAMVDRAFQTASNHQPCVLILEDLDKLTISSRVSLSYLLNKLDGMDAPHGILVIATTNDPHRLDPALLHRPSRFDRVWEFKLPEYAERLAMLALRGKKHFSQAALERAAQESQGFSMAYVQETIMSALMLSITQKTKLGDAHLDETVRQLRAQIKMATTGSKPIGVIPAVGFALNGHNES